MAVQILYQLETDLINCQVLLTSCKEKHFTVYVVCNQKRNVYENHKIMTERRKTLKQYELETLHGRKLLSTIFDF